MRIDQGRRADDEIHAISHQLVLDDFLLGFDHVIATLGEVLEGDVFFDPIAGAVEIALAKTGQEHHRFAQGFARDGADVDADTADHGFPLDDSDFLADLGRLNRGFLSGGTRTDH